MCVCVLVRETAVCVCVCVKEQKESKGCIYIIMNLGMHQKKKQKKLTSVAGHVDQPTATRSEQGQEGPDDVDLPHEVDVYDTLYVRLRHDLQAADVTYARVVDHTPKLCQTDRHVTDSHVTDSQPADVTHARVIDNTPQLCQTCNSQTDM